MNAIVRALATSVVSRMTLALLFALPSLAAGQLASSVSATAEANPDTTAWTTADDHKHMLAMLGIRALRPGPSGREGAPNQANYDEALANPYPRIPDVLTLDVAAASRARRCGRRCGARRSSRRSNAKSTDGSLRECRGWRGPSLKS